MSVRDILSLFLLIPKKIPFKVKPRLPLGFWDPLLRSTTINTRCHASPRVTYLFTLKPVQSILLSFNSNLLSTFTDLIIGGGPSEDPSPTLIRYLAQEDTVKQLGRYSSLPSSSYSLWTLKKHSLDPHWVLIVLSLAGTISVNLITHFYAPKFKVLNLYLTTK